MSARPVPTPAEPMRVHALGAVRFALLAIALGVVAGLGAYGFRLLIAHGHAEGDAILAAVGATLSAVRATDLAARLGGDEFALLLLHDHSDDVDRATRRIEAALTACMATHRWPITFSIGVATYPTAPRTVAVMISAADALMYEVKRNRKSGVKTRELGARPSAA